MTERLLARISHFVIVAVMGYVLGLATAQPIADWYHSLGKEDHRAPAHALSERPVIKDQL